VFKITFFRGVQKFKATKIRAIRYKEVNFEYITYIKKE